MQGTLDFTVSSHCPPSIFLRAKPCIPFESKHKVLTSKCGYLGSAVLWETFLHFTSIYFAFKINGKFFLLSEMITNDLTHGFAIDNLALQDVEDEERPRAGSLPPVVQFAEDSDHSDKEVC